MEMIWADFGALAVLKDDDALFGLRHTDLEWPVRVESPYFAVNGAVLSGWRCAGIERQSALASGGREVVLRCQSTQAPGLDLLVTLRGFDGSPVLRMQYRLSETHPEGGRAARFRKQDGRESLRYLRISQPGAPEAVLNSGALAEYQLSHFDPVQHSYLPYREDRSPEMVLDGLRFTGPVALFHTPGKTLVAAYEHGADAPDAFLGFTVEVDGADRALCLDAWKGNTFDGQLVDGWESVFFELGLYPGALEQFLPEYRRFFLEEVCENRESRRPYIFYNTWNYQERQRYFHGRPYLESMHAARMLDEIDAAHRLGVDVFVVDTGWYEKTGDWLPNRERFPDGLMELKRRLDGYGMRLGLWFNPTVAALTSRVFTGHPEWEMTWHGRPRWRGPVWETEESTGMCLASDYASAFIETMVRLHETLGVSYFKWDAVQQYGCDSALHNHGGEHNTPQERADCYAYSMGRSMIRIVEEVTRRCPGVIVDFDITEGGRFVGLGFLSAGKFFLVNNGPYFSDFDIPKSVKVDPDTINVFFYPGPARPRICRTGARFDPLVPSILFLTHYLTDGPQLSQENSLASLALGGNGLWGDLLALDEGDFTFWGSEISRYKAVAEAATRAAPIVRGFAGSSPEIHEKIDAERCAGLVAFFTAAPGTFTHVTAPLAVERLGNVEGADHWEVFEGGCLLLRVTLPRDGAKVVTITAKEAG